MPNQPFSLDENIIKQLGLESLPEERRVAMINQMTELIQKRVMLRLIESLSEADAVEAEKLADQPDQLMAFFASRVGDISRIVVHETEKLKNELRLGALPLAE